MKNETARTISALAEEYSSKLNATLETLRAECPADEFAVYADGIAQVLEHLQDDILGPIYRDHPDLDPRPRA